MLCPRPYLGPLCQEPGCLKRAGWYRDWNNYPRRPGVRHDGDGDVVRCHKHAPQYPRADWDTMPAFAAGQDDRPDAVAYVDLMPVPEFAPEAFEVKPLEVRLSLPEELDGGDRLREMEESVAEAFHRAAFERLNHEILGGPDPDCG